MSQFKVEVTSAEKVNNEVIAESKKVLEAIAKKYNCKFEFYQIELKAKANAVKKKLQKQSTLSRVGLSYGGEIEL